MDKETLIKNAARKKNKEKTRQPAGKLESGHLTTYSKDKERKKNPENGP